MLGLGEERVYRKKLRKEEDSVNDKADSDSGSINCSNVSCQDYDIFKSSHSPSPFFLTIILVTFRTDLLPPLIDWDTESRAGQITGSRSHWKWQGQNQNKSKYLPTSNLLLSVAKAVVRAAECVPKIFYKK